MFPVLGEGGRSDEGIQDLLEILINHLAPEFEDVVRTGVRCCLRLNRVHDGDRGLSCERIPMGEQGFVFVGVRRLMLLVVGCWSLKFL